jgi:hypothetical protein
MISLVSVLVDTYVHLYFKPIHEASLHGRRQKKIRLFYTKMEVSLSLTHASTLAPEANK